MRQRTRASVIHFVPSREFSAMTRTAFRLALIVAALAGMPAHAQQRVFVSGLGLDTNPCTVNQPCRTFQHAHDTVAANGEIDVLDPAGYGPLVITKGISVQAHGFSGITATSGDAITVSVMTLDPVSLNGLLLDGGGTGNNGIHITAGLTVQILNSVIRHFTVGIFNRTSAAGTTLLVEDTVASDGATSGITVNPLGANTQTTLNRITANNNQLGVVAANGNVTIANSVMSNNSNGLRTSGGTSWLAKNVISGNGTGVFVLAGTLFSYGDNYINDNTTPVTGSLTPVTTQ
jgi:hypothetical protein